MTDSSISRLSPDVVIIGGGIAGLWTLNVLCNQGYNAILLESQALGSEQTVASQGMIHGGIKYTLAGALSGASEAIADMPDHWRACLRGEGDVNLRGVQVLSEHFYLWSTTGLGSRLSGFFASKLVRGRVDGIDAAELPNLFRDPAFKGKLYKLVDIVMDTKGMLQALADNYSDRIFKVDSDRCTWTQDPHDLTLTRLHIAGPDGELLLQPDAFVFAAGRSNGKLLEGVGATAPEMQLRPLQQVMVRHRLPYRFYGHCLGAETTPRLTISSHSLADGSQVWYLGGALAEKGATQTAEQVMATAQLELAALMPWVDFKDAEWAAWPIARAEPLQHNHARPDNAFAAWADGPRNVIAAWPTKLTLSPHLAAEVLQRLQERRLQPSRSAAPQLALPRPSIALAPWETAFGIAGGHTS